MGTATNRKIFPHEIPVWGTSQTGQLGCHFGGDLPLYKPIIPWFCSEPQPGSDLLLHPETGPASGQWCPEQVWKKCMLQLSWGKSANWASLYCPFHIFFLGGGPRGSSALIIGFNKSPTENDSSNCWAKSSWGYEWYNIYVCIYIYNGYQRS